MTEDTGLYRDALEHIDQGIAVFDSDRRLALWNKRYQEISGFPDGFLRAGMEVFDIALCLAERGDLGEGDPEELARMGVEETWRAANLERLVSFRGGTIC